MRTLTTSPVRMTTVRLIGRILNPIAETGVISIPELNEIMSNLRHLAQKGEMIPDMMPKLLTQKEAADMLGISFPHFRNLEREGAFPFKRRMVGSAVRYYNTDLVRYILSLDDASASAAEAEVIAG